jgi:hypothetical protein
MNLGVASRIYLKPKALRSGFYLFKTAKAGSESEGKDFFRSHFRPGKCQGQRQEAMSTRSLCSASVPQPSGYSARAWYCMGPFHV